MYGAGLLTLLRARMAGGTTLVAAAMLAGCLAPDRIEAEDAWVRLPAATGRPGSGYFTLHGGAAAATLISVRADRAIRTEMHASMKMGGAPSGGAMSGGAMTMRPIATVPVPAHAEVRFAPGGRHLMLYDINPAVKPGKSTILTFTFADGTRIERRAWVVGPGDAAPQ